MRPVSPNRKEGSSPAQALPRRSVCAPTALSISFYRRPGLERRTIMSPFTWLQHRKRDFAGQRRGAHSSPRQRTTFRPRLEVLEGRDVPSTLTVTNLNDNNIGATLRNEIAAAQSGDAIVFAKGLSGTIDLSGNSAAGGFELYLNKNLDIEGPGAKTLAIRGANSRVFECAAGVTVTLSGLTIEGGIGRYGGFDPDVNDGLGGGILNWGTLTVNGCTLTANDNTIGPAAVDLGGAVYNAGTLTLTGSTVTRNYAGEGAGIYNASTGILTVLNSSVTRNHTVIAGTVLGECDLHNDGQFTVDSHSKFGVIC
jgi:hypothetical protein